MPVIKAKGKLHGQEVEATAVNPGDWFGKVWIVYVADCFDPPLYAVESDTCADAINEFIESEHGKIERIDVESAGGDYGYKVSPGDQVGGQTFTEAGWIDLKGNFTTDPEKGKYIHEPDTTGQGEIYDGESVMVVGEERSELPWPCLYFGEGLPACGVDPRNYCYEQECQNCDKKFFPKTDGADGDFCSLACREACEGEDAEDE